MSMRVDNQNAVSVGGTSSSSLRQVGAADGRAASGVGDDASSDVVKLSGASNLIALAKNLHSADRQSRISSIAAQFRAGTYQVDSQNVSKAILGHLGS